MIIAYIAHPVGGNVGGNIEKILRIVREINLQEPDVVPFVPYLADILAMDDANPIERERGIKNDTHVLKNGGVNQIRLYGHKISSGMRAELNLAKSLGIEVRCSEHLKAEL